jgi:hypothetical protein
VSNNGQDSGGDTATGTTALSENNWYYITGVYNGSALLIYVNGSLEGVQAHSGTFSSTDPTSIGAMYDGSNVCGAFTGTIDEVRIYNRSLSAEEISELYNATKARLDYGDVRFAQNSIGLGYWMESDNKFWVKVPSVAAGGTADVQMYYGNPSASSASNGNNTFRFFDSFDDGWPDGKWSSSIGSVANSIYDSGSDAGNVFMKSNTTAGSATFAVRTRALMDSDDTRYIGAMNTNGGWLAALKRDNSSGETQLASNDGMGETTSVSNWTTDAWKVWDIFVEGSTQMRAFENGAELLGSPKITSPADSSSMRAMIYLPYYSMYCDWILLRNYVSPEPTVTSGEESQLLQTDGDGNYNYTFTAPFDVGIYPVKVNSTYSGIYGENETDLTVEPYVYVSLPISTVDFGAVDLLSTYSTESDSPEPFLVQNDGNVAVNVTIYGTDFWQRAPNPTDMYQFKCRANTSSCPVGSAVDWTNIPNSTSPATIVANLSYAIGANQVKSDIKITVPLSEPAGPENSILYIIANQA